MTYKGIDTELENERYDSIKAAPKPRAKPQDKPDIRLRNLESLHQKTNVQANIKLPEGRRIKLDNTVSVNRAPPANLSKNPKRTLPPTFEHDFADLKDEEHSKTLVLSDGSDDDLPDTHQILAAYDARKTAPSSSSDTYTVPEIDELIRTMHYSDSAGVEAMDVDAEVDELDPTPEPSPPKRRRKEASPPRRLVKRQRVDSPPVAPKPFENKVRVCSPSIVVQRAETIVTLAGAETQRQSRG